ncbi:hypothetical protein [Lactobacillus agrestimuris]|uniref:hypothetical protein n=1 Tax=Lactobacillus agrestimuris TaxID=2941328 RepID=UPI002042BE32|nr:hypothetical protein [Lactobacillus agrestimuris]
MREINIKHYKKQKLLRAVIIDIAVILGSILIFSKYSNKTIAIVGVLILLAGLLYYAWSKFHYRKNKLEEKLDKQEDEFVEKGLKDIIGDFGIKMVILGIVFLFAVFVGGIWLAYWITKSWIAAICVFFAYEFVTDLRDYMKLVYSED